MMLLIVDVLALTVKAYFASLTLLSARYQPKKERYYFNQYWLTSVCYYISSLLKYALIEAAFATDRQIVCYFTRMLMITGFVGCIVFVPSIWVALKEADVRHIMLVKGEMRGKSTYESVFFDADEDGGQEDGDDQDGDKSL